MRADRRNYLPIKNKIKTLAELKKITSGLKARGKVIVFTNGCFDILHYGHVKYLEDARKMGDCLVVAVNSDASVRKIKGHNRPIVGQHDRLNVLAGLASVDFALLFKQETPLKIIKELKPDVLVKGGDWSRDNIVGADIVFGSGGRVLSIKLEPGCSTTELIKRIAKRYKQDN